MTVLRRSIVCDRVRAQVSLQLDGELSQLESRMVDAHLARCAECREFEADVSEVTQALRAAPLEPLAQPVTVQRLRRASISRAQVSVAAAVAVAMLGALTQIGDRQSDPSFTRPVRFQTEAQLTREVEQIIADGRAFSHRSGPVTPL
jgi:predicted anti-sigma-YlaC factor YlaD